MTIKPDSTETVTVVTKPLYPEQDAGDQAANDIMMRERPTETIIRRLDELQLSRQQMAKGLYFRGLDITRINTILDEEDYPTIEELYVLLDYVAMELVAIPDNIRNRGQDGHWYHGERCQYCGVNIYDAYLYAPGPCPSNPTLPQNKSL